MGPPELISTAFNLRNFGTLNKVGSKKYIKQYLTNIVNPRKQQAYIKCDYILNPFVSQQIKQMQRTASLKGQAKVPGPQKRFKNMLKSVDIYAKPIQLTYQGKEKFRSTCGGYKYLTNLKRRIQLNGYFQGAQNVKLAANFGKYLFGLLSMIVILFIVSIFAYNLLELVNRNRTQIKKNTIVQQTNSYTPPENLSARNITIAFRLSDLKKQFFFLKIMSL